jgi:hypothetical protein
MIYPSSYICLMKSTDHYAPLESEGYRASWIHALIRICNRAKIKSILGDFHADSLCHSKHKTSFVSVTLTQNAVKGSMRGETKATAL